MATLGIAVLVLEGCAWVAHLVVWREALSIAPLRAAREELLRELPAERGRDPGTVVAGQRGTGGDYYDEVLHPFLGFVRDPTVTPRHSDLGFPDLDVTVDPPDPRRVVVGVFGGSFADGLATFAEDALRAGLQAAPAFAGKEVRVMTLAMAGYKQPQQLMTLGYLLTLGVRFDVVINLDGFNEVALSAAENLPKHVNPFFPRNWFGRMGGYARGFVDLRGEREALIRQRRWAARMAEGSLLRFSAAANVLWRAWDANRAARLARVEAEALARPVPAPEQLGYAIRGPAFAVEGEAAVYAELARHWGRSSLQMHRLATANGARYVHFLQPNQYVEGSKPMPAVERQRAFTADHPFRRSVVVGYPLLAEEGTRLRAAGVDFTDLTPILADHPEPLYTDDCCHLGPEGYRIVAGRIAAQVVAALAAPAAAPPTR